MKIECDGQWEEALAYFTDPDIVAKMKRLGLRVERIDATEEVIYLDTVEDREDAYCRSLLSISDWETTCKPCAPVASK